MAGCGWDWNQRRTGFRKTYERKHLWHLAPSVTSRQTFNAPQTGLPRDLATGPALRVGSINGTPLNFAGYSENAAIFGVTGDLNRP